jgi:hypothetical protein
MERSTVIRLGERRSREQRLARAMDARRRLEEVREDEERSTGRVWVNGVPVGEHDPRFGHLAVFHD